MKLLPPSRIDPFRNSDRPDDSFEACWRVNVRRRVAMILCLLFAGTTIVFGRLVQLQVFQHEQHLNTAVNQQQDGGKFTAMRGDVRDRNGVLLAYSVNVKSVFADATDVIDPQGTAAKICAVMADCDTARLRALEKTLSSKKTFVYVARRVSDREAQRIIDLKLPGIAPAPLDETRRYYPKRELASHVLGAVNIDNEGIAGIEGSADKIIRGTDGHVQILKDGSARRKYIQVQIDRQPVPGASVELTIDANLQHIAERELLKGVKAHKAEGGTAIIMDSQTGEIRALANYPDFNPNSYNQSTEEDRRNRATQEIYEPGSTFKIVTAAAAIEDGIVQPSDLIDCSEGQIQIGRRKPIKDTVNHGVITFEDVIVESSNVGAIKVGFRLGPERLDRYVQRYGFGQILSPDFKGQSGGILPPAGKMSDSTLASMSMGYEVGVTPLQMVTAVNSVATGGVLLEPHLIHAVIRNGVREVTAPKALRRTINAETAAVLTGFMEGVTERGTGKKARLDGYQVAGKTGTSKQIVDGRYAEGRYNGSFVGFVPSRKPVLTILVVIDNPSAGLYYGGEVAAPVFKQIAEASLRQLAVAPTINPAPRVVVADHSASPQQTVRRTSTQPLILQAGGPLVMPDVRGLGLREAMSVLGRVGLTVHPLGSGTVVEQTPAPGEPIEAGGWSGLQLRRATADAARRKSGGGQ